MFPKKLISQGCLKSGLRGKELNCHLAQVFYISVVESLPNNKICTSNICPAIDRYEFTIISPCREFYFGNWNITAQQAGALYVTHSSLHFIFIEKTSVKK